MLLVTGATGKVGTAVLAELANGPHQVRALVGDSSKLAIRAPNIEVVTGDFSDPTQLDSVFNGVDAAFIASALEAKMVENQLKFVEAAKRMRLKRVVQLSTIGANSKQCCVRSLRWLGQVENAIESSGIASTTLRASFFFQNLVKFAPGIAQDGVIAGPFRNIKWPWIDARDVGAVAATALIDPSHEGKSYTLTSPESLSFHEIAERLSAVLQTPIRYLDISANEARARLRAANVPPVLVEATLELWDAFASGYIKIEPNDLVKTILGREPRTLEDFARDHKSRFQRAA